MAWIFVILHVLTHTDSSFLTLRSEGFGNSLSLLIAISISSASLIAFNFGNKGGFRYCSKRYKSLDKFQFWIVLWINYFGKYIEERFKLQIFKNGTKNKVQKRINIISYGLVNKLGYLGLIILNLVPAIPFAKEAGLLGSQLLGLENALPVALFFNGLRIFLLFKIFF